MDREEGEMESKSWKTSDSRVVMINLGTLRESNWEEELLISARMQF